MKDLEKILMKKMSNKEPSEMSPEMLQAKEEVLQELIQAMQELRGKRVGSDLGAMQKVSVMSPDKEGLKEGLEKAEDVLEMMPEEGEMEEMEMPEEDEEEDEDLKKKMK